MTIPTTCPGCAVSLEGDEIPEHLRELFGNRSHFSRVVVVKQRDFVATYRCPNCGHEWGAATR